MMNEPEVGGMRQEDYSKDWVMHIGALLREQNSNIQAIKLLQLNSNQNVGDYVTNDATSPLASGCENCDHSM